MQTELELAVFRSALEEIQAVAMADMDDASKTQQILAIVRTTLDPQYVGN